jgi:hypothetical protein
MNRAFLVLCIAMLLLGTAPELYGRTWTTVYSFLQGGQDGQLGWEFVPDAPGQLAVGPASFFIQADGSVLVADSVNHRILRAKPSGEPLTPVDLSPVASQAGLTHPVSAGDIVVTSNGSILVADHANTTVHVLDANGKFVRSIVNAYGMGEAFLQINRMQADQSGRVFIEDLSKLKTLVMDGAGVVAAVLPRFTSLTIDDAGNIYRPLFEGDTKSRKIDVHDAKGNLLRTLGTISCSEDIIYINPIGVNASGSLFIYLATRKAFLIVGLNKTGKEFLREEVKDIPPWRGSGFPYRLGRDGALYLMAVEGKACTIQRVWAP